MVKSLVGAVALAALPSALAFRNTSPFFLFSTADLTLPSTGASIAQADQTSAGILDSLKNCPTRSYIIIEQAGVSSADYAGRHAAPALAQYMTGEHAGVKTTFAVSDVVGQVDASAVAKALKSTCGSDVPVHKIEAPVATSASRKLELQTADDTLVDLIGTQQNFTVIYITTPTDEQIAEQQLKEEHPPYEMETSFGDSVQMELKRDLSSHTKRANASDAAGLFEKYQYFTPGLFMGFAAIIPLFLILLVGIRALTSLEVSYFAFSKEMGPNAQKKQ